MVKIKNIENVIWGLLIAAVLIVMFNKQIEALANISGDIEMRILIKAGLITIMLILSIIMTIGLGTEDREGVN